MKFNRLAGPDFDATGEQLRRMLSLCFAVHNPEDKFHLSDYYCLIQKLFEDDLTKLRSDLAVLTFNYDPYLEFLLRRAYKTRCEAVKQNPSPEVEDAILSGFALRNASALETSEGFCLLKLHGTCALPTRGEKGRSCPTHEDFFEGDAVSRFRSVLDPNFMVVGFSPIYFPWEIIHPNGEFVGPNEFRGRNDVKNRQKIGGYQGDVDLYTLFKAIWHRARSEVRKAAKLSFVGLSMHDYLKPGLGFLLRGGSRPSEIVVADKDPQKPIERLRRWLREFGCGPRSLSLRSRQDFEEFIREELEPIRE